MHGHSKCQAESTFSYRQALSQQHHELRSIVAINLRIWMRKSHRWGAILVALPFLLVIVTGILLQLKKEWSWVQPPTQRGKGTIPIISFANILDAVRLVPVAAVKDWSDIERLDVQPRRGMVKVQSRNRWEVQIDLQTGQVLQIAERRSDWIESLHDGSWFHDRVKLYVFLPVAGVVLGLWFTGIYLLVLPWIVKWQKRRRESIHS